MRAAVRLLLAATVMASAVALRADEAAVAEIQLQLADLLYADGRYSEALEAYRRAEAAPDAGVKIRAGRGLVLSLLRVGRFDEARRRGGDLAAAAPRDPQVLAVYADALWAAGLFEESERVARDALAVDPALPRARHGLARALAARNRLDEAIDEVQAALAAAPGEGEFHHTLGGILQRLHRFDEAAEAFSSYVNLIPNRDRSDKVLWARAQVRFLRSFGRRRPLEMAGASPDMVYTIPFRLVRDKVTVEARVNGGGRMDFVLDTGSEMTVVSRQTARRSGIQPITWMQSAGVGEFGLRGLQVGRIDSLEIGSLKIRHVPCLIKNPPLGGLPTREADAFSPLALGLSVSIDYARRLVTIGRRVPRPPSELELPLWVYRLALVRGTVNAHPASFVVDTGGEVISISQATAGVIGMPPGLRRIPLKVYGTSGWDRDAFLLPGVDLAFHSIRLPRTPVVVLNLSAPSALLGFQLGGIVGHRFLSRYHVTIDLERSTLALASIG